MVRALATIQHMPDYDYLRINMDGQDVARLVVYGETDAIETLRKMGWVTLGCFKSQSDQILTAPIGRIEEVI